jgi:hypothetical protein
MEIVKKFCFKLFPERFIENAILGQATVLKIWETDLTVNDRPQVGFLLNVQHPSGLSYEAETRAVIFIIHLPQIQPGATVADLAATETRFFQPGDPDHS